MESVNENEIKIVKFWNEEKIFEKSLEKGKKKKYVFYDGPPFATGLPHYGHILASTIKDTIPRFWTMKGYYVRRVWGWDCHGLPIETLAEKELGIKTKDEIEKKGVKVFNDFCRSKVMTYSSEWGKVVERMGRWVDFNNSYKTMDNEYIESVWWAFKQMHEKGFLYEGEKILMYCPRCETPLSKSEISMDNSYKNVKEDSLVVKFKLKNTGKFKQDVYALAWTTTPWTLPSNLALTVNPELEYVYVKDKKENAVYLMARSVINNFFKSEEDHEVVDSVKGKKLDGMEYEPLFPYFKQLRNSFRIILGDFVSAEEGTGIVHTAPAFGEDDYNVCKANKIDFVQPVDEKGRFTKEIIEFHGMSVFEANPKIIEHLKKQGKIVLIKKVEHEYPFCYRCDSPLIYRALPAWFVNIQKVKPKLLKLNKKINWYPGFLKEGRFKHSIETAPDWNITRNRYWASAIPIWKSKSGEIKVIGSIEELKKYAINLPKGKIDMHKDFLDKIKLKGSNGEEMTRIPEVMDCWFESGAMPFAQFHYPFENKKLFEDNFPSDFVAEYIGQTRAWFYYMLVMSTILFDDIPFKNVLTTGTILAEDGSKMSKSKNNFPDPTKIFEKYGVDSLRFYLLSTPVMNADNVNFSEKGVEEVYKKVMGLVYNVLKFYEINKIKEKSSDKSSNLTDKWVISRLKETGTNVDKYLTEYNTVKACNEIRNFVEDLSTWYVRLNRDRINDKKEARETLRYVLEEFSKIAAPILPFASEIIYLSLNKNKSVHLESFPEFKAKDVDKNLLEVMNTVREIVSSGLRERDKSQIGLKWPLSKVVVYMKGKENLKKFEEIIKEQLNVKEIQFKSLTSKGTELVVELDTKITSELEAEGYARELIRQIQAFRKEIGLEKGQMVETIISTDDEFKRIINGQNKFISERTNSKKLDIVTTGKENFKNTIEFRIKDKRGYIGIMTTNK